jgi:hypothetical protein
LAAVLAALACSDAGGEVNGGGVTDAGAEATKPPAPVEGPCNGSGTKWSDLYRDIFGPTGQPGSCGYLSYCHGTPDGDGARSRGGIQCFDKDGCWQSFHVKGLVSDSDAGPQVPEESGLLSSVLRLRRPDGTISGFMPQAPSNYLYAPACIDRMKAWIANGAQDD